MIIGMADALLDEAGLAKLSDPAREAMAALERKLDAAALEAFKRHMDFARGPTLFGQDEPHRYTATVKAEAVPQGWEPPVGWVVYRYADWVAAGRPLP